MNYNIRFVLIFVTAAALLGGCSGSRDTDDETQQRRAKLHYQIGLDALQKNQLPKAFEELMLAEKIDPEMPEALDTLGYAWRLRGNQKKSEEYYKRAIRAGSGSISHTNYGSLLIEMKRYAEAKENLEKALKDPRYHGQFIANVLLGDANMGLEKYEEAMDAYRQAGRLNPNQTLTRIKEAKVFIALEKPNFALALYETMLREDPTNRGALEGALELYALQKERTLARYHLQNFISHPSVSKQDRAWATSELVKLR